MPTADAAPKNEQAGTPPQDKRTKIVEALMALAAEQPWENIAMTDVALRAGLTLADFRDCFPSKGAVLGGFSRMIDRKVLEAANDDLLGEPARDRLFDVLMRRLDAMAPYREGLREVRKWMRRDPVSAMALNQVAINSMRFMLEAANIECEGPAGALKLQGLVLAWGRILDVWFEDDTERFDRTMAALDRELERGGRLAQRVDDLDRIAAPLRAFAGALLSGGRDFGRRVRERWPDRRAEDAGSDADAGYDYPGGNEPPVRH
ncbi:MAG: TetR/AcrR family transcriptional regulator [Beijerinckiaceae bacterium]